MSKLVKSDLMSSYPLLCQRDLQDQLGVMLRPTSKEWFEMKLQHGLEPDNEGKRWLEWVTTIMRRAMYDPFSFFSKAMKEGDGDYSCFGQTVTAVRLNSQRNGLLYRCYHLRDVAWSAGPTYITNGDEWLAKAAANRPMGRSPQVVMGRPNRR